MLDIQQLRVEGWTEVVSSSGSKYVLSEFQSTISQSSPVVVTIVNEDGAFLIDHSESYLTPSSAIGFVDEREYRFLAKLPVGRPRKGEGK